MRSSKSILQERSFRFAISIVTLYKELCNEQKEFVMSKQLLRSGTSIGANISESKNAESTKDFMHKNYIAQKECAETIYWLELLKETNYINNEKYELIYDEANQIFNMLRSTIATLKQKFSKSIE